jgi:phage terminase small subunit
MSAAASRRSDHNIDDPDREWLVQHGLIGIANKAMADMVRYAAEFGMTPSARCRVSATPPVGDDLDKYLR